MDWNRGIKTARRAPPPPRCTIFGPTPAYMPAIPLVLNKVEALLKNLPGLRGASAEGRG